MENKERLLVATLIFGAIAVTMYIGDIFFNATFGRLGFIFTGLQIITLVLILNTRK